MNKLYLHMPPVHLVDWMSVLLPFALYAGDGRLLREGRATLADLTSTVSRAKLVLILSSCDVTLLSVSVPPVAESKIKQALPSLVEDHLAEDISQCIFALVPRSMSEKEEGTDNKRVVAIVSRKYLEKLSNHFFLLGAVHIRALPQQLCLPYDPDRKPVWVDDYDTNFLITARLEPDLGVGVVLNKALEPLDNLSRMAYFFPTHLLTLHLPKDWVESYNDVMHHDASLAERIVITESSWLDVIASSKTLGFNLMSGLMPRQGRRIQWQTWRWPILLGTLLLLVNILGLNIQYWALKREVKRLSDGMQQIYKTNFPKEKVVAFPFDQMKKNVNIAERNAGQPAAYDFTVLLTKFSLVWEGLATKGLPKLVIIEYKDRTLFVQVSGELPEDDFRQALLKEGLELKKNNAEMWQIKGQE